MAHAPYEHELSVLACTNLSTGAYTNNKCELMGVTTDFTANDSALSRYSST